MISYDRKDITRTDNMDTHMVRVGGKNLEQ